MFKYINDSTLDVLYVDENDINLSLIDGYRLMTETEIDMYENPEKYLSDEEKLS